MVEYKCQRCGWISKVRTHYKKHLQRKFRCNPIVKDINPEILLEELDKDIFFEIDTYWVKVAGHDPANIIQKFGDRVKFMHVKDGPAKYNDQLAIDNPDPMTPVGKGTQNFPAIFKAASSKCEYLVIEMDKTAMDVFDALKQSVDFMKPYIL